VELLGGFRVVVDGNPVPPDAWRRRGADLVKLLALTPGHRLHREQVIDALWPDLGPESGGANLRKAVHFARRAIGGEEAIGTDEDLITLWPSAGVETDLEVFERTAEEAARTGDPGECDRAASVFGGDLLPGDRYEQWTDAPRQRLRLRYLELLKQARRWRDVLDIDPLDEEAHRELMQAAVDEGDRMSAIRQFERLRRVLADELGVAPQPESVALYERVLAMEGHEPVTLADQARALLDRGLVALNRGDLDQAETEATEARALAVEGALGRELGEASALLGLVAHQRGNWMQVFQDEFVEVTRERPGLAGHVFDAHLCLAEFSLYGGMGHEGVAAFALGLLELADRLQSVHGRALATLMLGETELLSGRLDAAEDALALSELLHREAESRSGRVLANQRLAEVDLARGRADRAEKILLEILDEAAEAPLAAHLLVRVHGALVEAATARDAAPDALEQADRSLHGREVCEPCSMGFLVAAAIGAAGSGDVAAARGYLDRADRIAGMWRGGSWQAGVWEARAVVRAAEGDGKQAAALFTEAADLFAQVGRPLAAERCRGAASALSAG
jgi:DNA-binding SARP family transcriptional activator